MDQSQGASGYGYDESQGAGGYGYDESQGAGGYGYDESQGAGGYGYGESQGAGGYGYDQSQTPGAGGYGYDHSQGAGGYGYDHSQGAGGYGHSQSQGANGGYGNAHPQGTHSGYGAAQSHGGHGGYGSGQTPGTNSGYPQSHGASAYGGGSIRDPHIVPDMNSWKGLKQLAAVLEVVARMDDTGAVRAIGRQVLEERKALEFQLARRRDCERRDKAGRAIYGKLVEERCKIRVGIAESERNITHLQDELCLVEREVKRTNDSTSVLREGALTARSAAAGGLVGKAESGHGHDMKHVSGDTLAKVQKEKKKMDKDRHQIEASRTDLAGVFRQKFEAQAWQRQLLQQLRQTDHERSAMLIAVETERQKLAALQAARVNTLTRRTALHTEDVEIAEQDEWHHRHPPASRMRGVPA